MVSTKKLLEALKAEGLIEDFGSRWIKKDEWLPPYRSYWTKGTVKVGHEVYGKTVEMYVHAPDGPHARLAARAIRAAGGKPDWGWCIEFRDRFSVEVSYFKGWHHWE